MGLWSEFAVSSANSPPSPPIPVTGVVRSLFALGPEALRRGGIAVRPGGHDLASGHRSFQQRGRQLRNQHPHQSHSALHGRRKSIDMVQRAMHMSFRSM